MSVLEGEVIFLDWEEIQAHREFEDFMAERADPHRQAKAVGLLTYCVNSVEGITDAERGLLREMLMAAQFNTMALWGATNLHRMEIVRALFEKLKGLINAS